MADRAEHLLIEALDPLALTADTATEGAPRSLTGIPGAALMGLAAKRCYGTVCDPYRVFHSGEFCFGPGLPIDDGEIGLPAPLSFHAVKGEEFVGADGRLSRTVRDLSRHDPRDDAQGQQFRDMWVTPSGRAFRVPVVGGMKTAISAETATAATGQLYGYAAVAPGTRFLARVAAADDDPDLEAVLAAMEGPGRVGRSRNTEFGRVRITRCGDAGVVLADVLTGGDPRPEGVALYAVSDVHLPLDPVTGTTDLGLGDGARIVETRSFVRSRTYSPFNGHWVRRGIERTVWAAGSVLTVTGADPAHLDQALGAGWGLDRELGLGWIARDPQLLDGVSDAVAASSRAAIAALSVPAASGPGPAEPTPLYKAMRSRAKARRFDLDSRGKADDLLAELEAMYRAAGALAAVQPGTMGPSASQWGEVQSALGQQDWQGAVGRILGRAEGREADSQWAVETGRRRFDEWLLAHLGTGPAPDAAVAILVGSGRVRTMIERLRRKPPEPNG